MEDLTYKRTNANNVADSAEREAINAYAEGYKAYLDAGKTERETVSETVAMVEMVALQGKIILLILILTIRVKVVTQVKAVIVVTTL